MATPVVVKKVEPPKPVTKELIVNSLTLECDCGFHLVRNIDVSPEHGKVVTYVCPNPDCEFQGQHYQIAKTVTGTEVVPS